MRKITQRFLCLLFSLFLFSCGNESPYLSGHIKRAFDAVMTSCDPYGGRSLHTCIIVSSAFGDLRVYDVTAREFVQAPNGHFPLKIKDGPVTDDLVTVVSEDKRFPFLLAFDRSQSAYYPIRLFPAKNQEPFGSLPPNPQNLGYAPHRSAAIEIDNRIIAVSTLLKEQRIALRMISKETGEIDKSVAPVFIDVPGGKPNRIAITGSKHAIITDENLDVLHTLDLSRALEIFSQKTKPQLKSIEIKMKSDKIYISKRDFGFGEKWYAVVFQASGKNIKLVNVDSKKIDGEITLDAYLAAGYFPDQNSNSCCDKVKNWFSVVTITGSLYYIEIKAENHGLKLVKNSDFDMKTEDNLGFGKLHVIKIIGGEIAQDSVVKKDTFCKREVFYISNFGDSITYKFTDSAELEAHAQHGEGENTVSRLGYATSKK